MTLTKTIMNILADGKTRSVSELIFLTGKPRKQVWNAICALKRNDYLDPEPVRYGLTEEGIEKHQRPRKTDPHRLALKSIRNARNRGPVAMGEGA